MRAATVLLAFGLLFSGCRRATEDVVVTQEETEVLLQIGSIAIGQSDLDFQLKEKHGGRSDAAAKGQALGELADQARWVQAALDAGLDRDPFVRAETARLLAARLRETQLFPKLKQAAAPVPEERLRAIYEAQKGSFASDEKRQIAVLWLDPGPDPARKKRYTEKLSKAREWFFGEGGLATNAEKGFSVLAVDHSEHAASRYKGGALGWFEGDGGSTPWERAVVEIVFGLGTVGDVSEVLTRPEGIFLVRLMGITPAVQRPFATVRTELERSEQNRLRREVEEAFAEEIRTKGS